MKKKAMSRRRLLGAGACSLAAAVLPEIASAQAPTGLSPKNEQTVRKYYAAWETKDWHALDVLLTDDFTFTSPNNDDHISKGVFKTRCWDPNVGLIEHFDLQQIVGHGNDAFVMYVLHIKNGKTIQNVEHFQMRDGKVEAVRCYFGQQNSYPAAVASGKR
jgi:ketosteroid isomerase-like protein